MKPAVWDWCQKWPRFACGVGFNSTNITGHKGLQTKLTKCERHENSGAGVFNLSSICNIGRCFKCKF